MVAGKIIPALATTTAMIVGAVQNELIKVINGCKDLTKFRNGYYNLAILGFDTGQPPPPLKTIDGINSANVNIKAIPHPFSDWDFIEINGPISTKEFLYFLKEKYNVNCSSINCFLTAIYNKRNKEYIPYFDLSIEDVYCKLSESSPSKLGKYLELKIYGQYLLSPDLLVEMPRFRYLIYDNFRV